MNSSAWRTQSAQPVGTRGKVLEGERIQGWSRNDNPLCLLRCEAAVVHIPDQHLPTLSSFIHAFIPPVGLFLLPPNTSSPPPLTPSIKTTTPGISPGCFGALTSSSPSPPRPLSSTNLISGEGSNRGGVMHLRSFFQPAPLHEQSNVRGIE